MSFSAGAILGTLGLDISEYGRGMLQAEGIAHAFPSIVTQFLANPLLGFAETAKEAAHGVVSAVESIGNAFHQAGLAAQRAGTSVEWLSRMAAVASTAGVSMGELVNGMKVLEKQAELAAEGDQAAAKGFARLGISIQEAARLSEQPQALFERVKESIDSISNPSERTAAALAVVGRQGFNLVPFLTKSSEETKKLADVMEGLGGTVNTQEAEMGEKFGTLESIVSAAWTGIKKAIAEPILQYVSEHFDELVAKVQEVSENIREALGEIMPDVVQMIPALLDFGGAVLTGIVEAFRIAIPVIKALMPLLQGLAQFVGSVLKPVFAALAPVLKFVADALGFIFDIIGKVLGGIGKVITAATDAIGLTHSKDKAAQEKPKPKTTGPELPVFDEHDNPDSPYTPSSGRGGFAAPGRSAGAARGGGGGGLAAVMNSVAMEAQQTVKGATDEMKGGADLLNRSMQEVADFILGQVKPWFEKMVPELSRMATAVSDFAQALAPIIRVANAIAAPFDKLLSVFHGGGGGGGGGGGSFGAAGGGGRGGVTIQNVNLAPFDPDDASSKIAAKMQPAVRAAARQQQRQWEAAAASKHVATALGM